MLLENAMAENEVVEAEDERKAIFCKGRELKRGMISAEKTFQIVEMIKKRNIGEKPLV